MLQYFSSRKIERGIQFDNLMSAQNKIYLVAAVTCWLSTLGFKYVLPGVMSIGVSFVWSGFKNFLEGREILKNNFSLVGESDTLLNALVAALDCVAFKSVLLCVLALWLM